MRACVRVHMLPKHMSVTNPLTFVEGDMAVSSSIGSNVFDILGVCLRGCVCVWVGWVGRWRSGHAKRCHETYSKRTLTLTLTSTIGLDPPL